MVVVHIFFVSDFSLLTVITHQGKGVFLLFYSFFFVGGEGGINIGQIINTAFIHLELKEFLKVISRIPLKVRRGRIFFILPIFKDGNESF